MDGDVTIEVLNTNNEFEEYLTVYRESVYSGLAIPSEIYKASFDNPVTLAPGDVLSVRLTITVDDGQYDMLGLDYPVSESVTIVGSNRKYYNSGIDKEKVNWKREGF